MKRTALVPSSLSPGSSLTFLLSLCLACVIALGASPGEAHAQYPTKKRRNETVVVRAKVDSWSPQRGPVGTRVVLRGNGLTKRMSILVGGRPVQMQWVSNRELRFAIPQSYGDGRIVLRKSGNAADIVVGNFQVWTQPEILGLSPDYGAPGTRIIIRGRHFQGTEKLWLGQASMPIHSWSPTALNTTIPAGAQSGPITLQDAQGTTVRSRQDVRVVEPTPIIVGFAPESGPPGTLVRISGTYLGSDLEVRYGRSPAKVVRSAPTWIDIEVPLQARRDRAFKLISRRGRTKTSTRFQLSLPPKVTSISPDWGAVGTRVELRGDNFSARDQVSLAGKLCRIISIRGRSITVEVPPFAQSGRFRVLRDGQQVASSAQDFDVAYQPILSNVQPQQGAVGTKVVITGQNLDGAQIYLGNTLLRPKRANSGRIVVIIPERATSGSIRVVSRVGEARWNRPFTVWELPELRRVAPGYASPGDRVSLIGRKLDHIEVLYVGTLPMPIASRLGSSSVVATVPAGAKSDWIYYQAYGQRLKSAYKLDIVEAPAIASFAPAYGGAGTRVSIRGQGFDERTSVRLGRRNVKILRWTSTELQIEIPNRIRKDDYFVVKNRYGSHTSAQPFGVVLSPQLRNMSPQTAKPQSEVTLYGRHLAPQSTVWIGGQKARVIGGGGSRLQVRVPNLPSGAYDVSVEYRDQRATSRMQLQVSGWAEITSVTPSRAKVGQRVKLTGQGLSGARFYFGAYEMPVLKSAGDKVWVSVPNGASGTAPITLVDGNHRSTSGVTLEVRIGRGKGPKVRDHRR